MKDTLAQSEFNFTGQQSVYHGKVRDVYRIGERHVVMVASDRISAFDYILPRAIPYKGQVLNQLAAYFLKSCADIVPTWWINSPDPCVSFGLYCKTIPIEMVIRGYLSGHAWREYKAGKRMICGVQMPEGMKENDRFPEPIITPATKAEEGHDEDISRDEILKRNIVPKEVYEKLEDYTRKLFDRGTKMAKDRGLILVDTKYEFGMIDGEIRLIDEIHTPDSSRYFYADTYQELQDKGERQKQLSKEFVREWLIENGFQGLEGQQIPNMPDDFVETVSQRYIELYEKITGMAFEKADNSNIAERVKQNVEEALKEI